MSLFTSSSMVFNYVWFPFLYFSYFILNSVLLFKSAHPHRPTGFFPTQNCGSSYPTRKQLPVKLER